MFSTKRVYTLAYLGALFALYSNSIDVIASPQSSFLDSIREHVGLSYDSFFAGPGLKDPSSLPPGFTGTPSDSGLNFFNYISIKYKIGRQYALDVQFRNQLVVTNSFEFRHQGQRFGVSGTLLRGSDWSFKGAINSDVPVGPLMGQIASERTLIFNPGLFASFNWEPAGRRWSVYAFMTPRIWFYRDSSAISSQDAYSGGLMSKPQYDFHINPSLNYRFNQSLSYRLGVTVEFLKNVGWSEIRRTYMPLDSGIIWHINENMSIYAYVMTSTPLDDTIKAYQLGTSTPPHWLQTASINVWIYGTAF